MNEVRQKQWWDNFNEELYDRLINVKSRLEDTENAEKVRPITRTRTLICEEIKNDINNG